LPSWQAYSYIGPVFLENGICALLFINPAGAPKVDDSFEQKMSAYSCAALLFYDPESSAMYITFFGGISRWRWNDAARKFEQAPLVGDKTQQTGYLDGMPWINEISTLVRRPGQTFEFVQQHNRLPAYVGDQQCVPAG
jgi:hypothetical protein